MKRAAIFYFILIFVFPYCASDDGKTINETTTATDELKYKVFHNGDTTSYLILRDVMLDYPPEDFIFYSVRMANNFEYLPAYLDVYHSTIKAYERRGIAFKEMDKRTKSFLIDYLTIASNKGVKEASGVLSELSY